jgi:hypothetical protein
MNDDFFGRRGVYQKAVAPSNPLTLTVRDLPKAERPAGFNGLIGRYAIQAMAKPTTVHVGDPITLHIHVFGPEYLGNVELPPLSEQHPLASEFRIPKDRAPGEICNGVKVFTQTIRATHENVTQIPPIELPYFDPDEGRYFVARSDAIPLTVSPTRVVTAQDAEGHAAPAPKSDLDSRAQGIAHNYSDDSALVDCGGGPVEWLESPVWLGIIGAPPVVYFALLGLITVRRRRSADPDGVRARRAYGKAAGRLSSLRRKRALTPEQMSESVLEAMREYLGGKLRRPSRALTCADAKRALKKHGVDAETLTALETLFAECEAGRYARAGAASDDPTMLARRARDLVKTLEKSLR